MILFRSVLSFVFLIAILAINNSCSVETAKAPIKKQLIILSDYLNQTDVGIFKPFAKQEYVDLKIIHMESDKIIGLMRNQGSNVQADLILINSLYDVQTMYKRDILQTIHFEKELDAKIKKISSTKYKFIGLGIDPFIIANSKVSKIRTYNELRNHPFVNDLDKKQLIPMLAPIAQKLKRVKANNWIRSFYKSTVAKDTLLDTLGNLLPILTTYTKYTTSKDSLYQFEQRFLTYPNARTSGVFFNIRTMAIVKQAQNYSVAKSFILFYSEENNNIQLNKKLNVLSTFQEGLPFRKYNETPSNLVQYYQTVDRVIKKID